MRKPEDKRFVDLDRDFGRKDKVLAVYPDAAARCDESTVGHVFKTLPEDRLLAICMCGFSQHIMICVRCDSLLDCPRDQVANDRRHTRSS